MDIFKRYARFMPLVMMTFIEGEAAAGGDGSGASSTERALEMLNEPEAGADGGAAPGAPAAGAAAAGDAGVDPAALAAALEAQGKPGDGAAAAAAPGAPAVGADGKPVVAPAAAAPQIDPQNWVTSEPVVKTISEVLGDYAKGADGQPMQMDQFKLVLEDAKALYEIADGKRSPDEMTSLLKQQYPRALQAIAESAAKQLGLKLAKPEDLKDAGPKDPALERIEALERERQQERDQVQQRQVQETRQKAFTGFTEAINTELNKTMPWLKDAPADVKEFMTGLFAVQTSGLINGNKDILGRFEKGNYTDAQRLFTEVNNKMLGAFQAWAKGLVAQKTAQVNNNPKIPARGAPPAPAGSAQKRDLTSFEGRSAAAMAEFDNPSS